MHRRRHRLPGGRRGRRRRWVAPTRSFVDKDGEGDAATRLFGAPAPAGEEAIFLCALERASEGWGLFGLVTVEDRVADDGAGGLVDHRDLDRAAAGAEGGAREFDGEGVGAVTDAQGDQSFGELIAEDGGESTAPDGEFDGAAELRLLRAPAPAGDGAAYGGRFQVSDEGGRDAGLGVLASGGFAGGGGAHLVARKARLYGPRYPSSSDQ